jgi:methylenetetrahydrofolate reductase (NADPH)
MSIPTVCAQAYLEFFASPEGLKHLLQQFETDDAVTWFAVDRKGVLQTNTSSEGPNAVTWGVFPEKEIIQPTIVEQMSFLAWKVH